MKKFYYKIVDLEASPNNWQREFDAMGYDGWELVQIVQSAISMKAIFKKADAQVVGTSITNQWT